MLGFFRVLKNGFVSFRQHGANPSLLMEPTGWRASFWCSRDPCILTGQYLCYRSGKYDWSRDKGCSASLAADFLAPLSEDIVAPKRFLNSSVKYLIPAQESIPSYNNCF
jgi:hypothetical protein